VEYKAKTPQRNSNVSHEHPLGEFITLAAGLGIILLFSYWALGLFSDMVVERISPELERQLFAGVSGRITQTASLAPGRLTHIQEMVQDLEPCVPLAYPIEVLVVESKEANAFALPGGYIVLTRGLLDMKLSENGLAFVLAHELAHFKDRDHLRGLGRALILSFISALITGPDSAISQFLAPVGRLGQAAYSRQRESKADLVALNTLNCAYGRVDGAGEFFKKVDHNLPKAPSGLNHYFGSHPDIQARLQAINEESRRKGYRQR